MSHSSLTSFGTVTSASPVAVVDINGRRGVTVAVFPGSGSNVLVEGSTTIDAANRSDANWVPWSEGVAGVVTTKTASTFYGSLSAVRITLSAGTSASAYEVTAI